MKKYRLIIILSIIIILLLSGLFCFNVYNMSKIQHAEVESKAKEVAELEAQLKDLEEDYDKALNSEVSKAYDVNLSKIKSDEKLIKSIVKKSFEYESADEYNENRRFVLKYVSKDSAFMKEVFIEDVEVKDKEGNASSLVADMGIKSKMKSSDIYYTDKNDDVYSYLVHVKVIPYYNNDIVRSEHMSAQQYFIMVDVDKEGKIAKFDYEIGYLD